MESLAMELFGQGHTHWVTDFTGRVVPGHGVLVQGVQGADQSLAKHYVFSKHTFFASCPLLNKPPQPRAAAREFGPVLCTDLN